MTNLDITTDPNQYDKPDISWKNEINRNSRDIFFGEYLKEYIDSWEGKNVLDVGSGNGWLLNNAKQVGAKTVLGIEPSKNNFEQSKLFFPHVNVIQTSLEDFLPDNQSFDKVVAVMSLPHIKDLNRAFKKIAALLNTNGEFLAVVPDFNYFKKNRRNYKVEVEELNPNEYLATITRPSGKIADLVRKDELYVQAAKAAGFDLIEQIPMTPTEAYLKSNPDFSEDPKLPLTQLFRFVKYRNTGDINA